MNTKIHKYDDDPTIQAIYEDASYEADAEVGYNEDFHETVSFWLNIYRKRRKITQKKIAQALHISQPGVCQMLKKPATVGTLWRLCNAMGAELEINIRFEGEGWKSLILGDDPLSPEDQAMIDAHRAAEEAAKADK
ncbi:MAG: hypothetical protein WCG15_08225 [Actinomycetes bacterium]